jgi:hypothetical protein
MPAYVRPAYYATGHVMAAIGVHFQDRTKAFVVFSELPDEVFLQSQRWGTETWTVTVGLEKYLFSNVTYLGTGQGHQANVIQISFARLDISSCEIPRMWG